MFENVTLVLYYNNRLLHKQMYGQVTMHGWLSHNDKHIRNGSLITYIEVRGMISNLIFFGLAVCTGLSIYLRMQTNAYRQEYVLSSPLAEAMRQLVGVAGGIYLSLVMLTGFLGMELPERISIAQIWLDPLAVFAIILACLQPLALAVWYKLTQRGR